MKKMNHSISTTTGAKETVLSFIKSMNKEDFNTARTYVSDDLVFEGVMGSRNKR